MHIALQCTWKRVCLFPPAHQISRCTIHLHRQFMAQNSSGFVYLFTILSYRLTSFRVGFVKKLSLISLPVLFFSIPNPSFTTYRIFYSLSWKGNLSSQRDQQKEPAVPSSWALVLIFSTIAKKLQDSGWEGSSLSLEDQSPKTVMGTGSGQDAGLVSQSSGHSTRHLCRAHRHKPARVCSAWTA